MQGAWIWNHTFIFLTPKRHFLARNHIIWRIKCKNPRWRVGGRQLEEPAKFSMAAVLKICKLTLFPGSDDPRLFFWDSPWPIKAVKAKKCFVAIFGGFKRILTRLFGGSLNLFCVWFCYISRYILLVSGPCVCICFQDIRISEAYYFICSDIGALLFWLITDLIIVFDVVWHCIV